MSNVLVINGNYYTTKYYKEHTNYDKMCGVCEYRSLQFCDIGEYTNVPPCSIDGGSNILLKFSISHLLESL